MTGQIAKLSLSRAMTSGAFLKACRTGSPEVVEKLLKTISQPDQYRTKADETPLHVAITSNPDPAAITNLLLDHKHDPNARGYRSQSKTPLHDAARRGCAETVKALVAGGARIDSVKKGDWTPLMVACAHGFVEVVRTLLEAGGNINAVNGIGETCLHLSARVSAECLKVCIEGGAGLLARTRNGRTSLHYAARAGRVDCARMLVNAGCGVGAKDKSGMNAAHEACVGGHEELVEMFLGLDRNAVWEGDCGGLTGLHHAAISGAVAVVKFLVGVSEGAVDGVDKRGNTALRLALFNGHSAIVRLLLDGGAKLDDEWIEQCKRIGKGKCIKDVMK